MKCSHVSDHKLNVCMIVPVLPPAVIGGAERQAIRLAHALMVDGITVEFLTLGRRRDPFYSDVEGIPTYRLYSLYHLVVFWFSRLLSKKSRPVPIEYKKPARDPNDLSLNRPFDIAEVLHAMVFTCSCFLFFLSHRSRLDLIHVHTVEWIAPAAVLVGVLFDKPVLVKDSTMNGFSKLETLLGGRWIKRWIGQRGNFIAVSQKIHENLQKEGVSPSSITYIPNGLDSSRFISEDGEIGHVLFVGNLSQQPAKGVDVLLLAWQKVIHHHRHSKLTIVGEGDLDKFRLYVREKKIEQVEFVGPQDNVAVWYQRASVFVLPSRREGLSNALLEAMAHGMSIVATDISGNQDMIQNRVNGLLVPPGDPDRLAEAILFYLENPETAKHHGKRARATVIGKCDMTTVARQYKRLYARLVGFHV